MRFSTAFAAAAAVAVGAEVADAVAPGQQPDQAGSEIFPEVKVVKLNKDYIVKLECVGCPFARRVQASNEAEWQQPPQQNALELHFEVDTEHHKKPTLLLNGRGIAPLEPMTPFINARQIPSNITAKDMTELGWIPKPYGIYMPLQYEHRALRTEKHGGLTIQFDVTALPLDVMNEPRFPLLKAEPYQMDKEQQKLVQLRLHHNKDKGELFIHDVSVIRQSERAQPFRMDCGRLAMVKTTYDPREWDQYGKFGTWARTQRVVVDTILGHWPEINVGLPLAVLALFCLRSARRWHQRRQQEWRTMGDDAEVALLASLDAPPAYADIPVIKIEEYD
ncbi:hypothetical protein ACEQ8H_003298 [Pleosporales sp. CAS-2024a]